MTQIVRAIVLAAIVTLLWVVAAAAQDRTYKKPRFKKRARSTTAVKLSAALFVLVTASAAAILHAQRPLDSTSLGRPVGVGQNPQRYAYSAWSRWTRVDGAEYRYRWGSDPTQSRYATNVDAFFEVRNRQSRPWEGAARSLDCAVDTLSRSQRVTVPVNGVRSVSFLTPNCGTTTNPFFRPNVVRSVRIDH